MNRKLAAAVSGYTSSGVGKRVDLRGAIERAKNALSDRKAKDG